MALKIVILDYYFTLRPLYSNTGKGCYRKRTTDSLWVHRSTRVIVLSVLPVRLVGFWWMRFEEKVAIVGGFWKSLHCSSRRPSKSNVLSHSCRMWMRKHKAPLPLACILEPWGTSFRLKPELFMFAWDQNNLLHNIFGSLNQSVLTPCPHLWTLISCNVNPYV